MSSAVQSATPMLQIPLDCQPNSFAASPTEAEVRQARPTTSPAPSEATETQPEEGLSEAAKTHPEEGPKIQWRELPKIPTQRLIKPHEYFPFDLFSGRALLEGVLPDHIRNELSYVRDHCMMPPYPWGHVIYHDFIMNHIVSKVPGDFAELGIGQGGTSVLFSRVAKQCGRKFLAIDSFEGLPPPDNTKDNPYFKEGDYRPNDGRDNYANFLAYQERFDVGDTLHVVKGFFCDAEIPEVFDKFAFVHLDSDLYDSVYDSFVKMWPRLSDGGAIIVDDFFHHAQGPARAVSDFFRSLGPNSEPPMMYVVPTYAVLIVKGQSAFSHWEGGSNGLGRPKMQCPRALDGNFYSFELARNCIPFMRATEKSVINVAQAADEAERAGLPTAAPLCRARDNAEAFLSLLRYPHKGARSGVDIMRYLFPLEDLFDVCEGTLSGMPGSDRMIIEIPI